jgi:hypothetical protein
MGAPAVTKTDSKSEPWSVQEPYLAGAFNQAQNNFTNQMAQGPYQGNYVAPTNQNQYDAASSQYNTAMGQSTQANQGILGAGYGNLASGFGAANGALGGLGSLVANNTGQNLVNTGQGITNQLNTGVQGQVNAAMQAANQNAAENTLPNLYRSAAGAGNLNSDRTAVAQGVVDRGLQQTAANMAGQLQAQNTQTGLSTAQNLTNQNMSGYNALGSLGSNIGQSGLNALSTSINNSGTIANQAQQGASTTQALDQSNLNNSIQQYQQNQQFPWQALQNYMGVVGGQNWGSQTQGTSTTTPSTLSTIGGIMGAVGSFLPK